MLYLFQSNEGVSSDEKQRQNAPLTSLMKRTSTMPKYLETITIINRDVDKARWRNVEEEFFRAGITNYKKFRAVEGDKLSDNDIKRYVTASTFKTIQSKIRTSHAEISSKNQVACFLSHTTLWSELLKSTDTYRTIMEDDLTVTPDFLYRMNQSIYSIPDDFDILLLGDIEHARTPWSAIMPGQQWVRVRRFYGCHAYVIKTSAARKLLTGCFPLECQLDTYIFQQAAQLDLKIYAHHPALVRQGKFPSTIQIKGDCLSCGRLQ